MSAQPHAALVLLGSQSYSAMMHHTICLVPTEATIPVILCPSKPEAAHVGQHSLPSTPVWQNTYPLPSRGLRRLVTGQRAVGVLKVLARSSRQW
ncbi:hypothetical protein LY76DRAFT_586967 [Colletotrichum caudatum]|nr:hypothetical protein LY76DRAFT_586967 [Colletotrichum caudatum]